MTKFTIVFLDMISILSIIYFFVIIDFSGIRTSFLWFWPVVSILSAGLSVCLFLLTKRNISIGQLSFSKVLLFLFWSCFALLLFFECILFVQSRNKENYDTQYMIILGAQVRGQSPSLTLMARIDTAADYLLAHPKVNVICSGGKGNGEDISEAECIANILLKKGIEKERISLEIRSTTTRENLIFSGDFLPSMDTPVLLVTNGFHSLRAKLTAYHVGYSSVYTLSANRFLATTPHYYVRELFALVKEMLVTLLSILN